MESGRTNAGLLTIVPVENDDLRNAVFAFRYRIYVEHMGRRQLHADHVRRIVVEPQDTSATIFAALLDGRVIGTVRGNSAADPTMAYYRKIYRLDDVDFGGLGTVQITTKLMIDPAFARTGMAARLIVRYADGAFSRGVRVDLLDCNGPLIPFFERMGYFSYCGWRVHKEYGTVRPMFFALDTVSYLRRIGSILHPNAAAHLHDGQYNGYALVRRLGTHPDPYTVLAGIEDGAVV